MGNTRPTLIERYCISLTKLAQACTPSMKMLSESAVNFMKRISNMKEFDLIDAKAGVPVCTRDGRRVRIVCFDAKDDEHPILALITLESGAETHQWYNANGRIDNNWDDERDLMMTTTKYEGFINIYRVGNAFVLTKMIHKTWVDAIEEISDVGFRVDTIKIEWED